MSDISRKPMEVTCFYDENGNMVFCMSSNEKEIKEKLQRGEPIEGTRGLIGIARKDESDV